MRISTNTIFSSGGTRISDLQVGISRTLQQISSNRKILDPADDPVGSARALVITQSDSVNDQFAVNRRNVSNSLKIAESTLGGVTDVLHNIKTSIVSAGNGVLTDIDRGFVANELQGQLDALVSLANASDGTDGYLFSGFSSSAPYSKTQGGAQYNGDQGQKYLQVDTSRQIPLSDVGPAIFGNIRTSATQFNTVANPSNTGQAVAATAINVPTSASLTGNNYDVVFDATAANFTITNKTTGAIVPPAVRPYVSGATVTFDGIDLTLTNTPGAPAPGDRFSIQPGNQDIFETLTDIIKTLRAPTNTASAKLDLAAGLAQANGNVDKSLNNVLTVRAKFGISLQEIDALDSVGENTGLTYKQQLSEIQDLDYAKAITELNQQQVILQAAQQSFVKTSSLSLFNYIT